MPLIIFEIKLVLTWSANCAISDIERTETVTVIDSEPYVAYCNFINCTQCKAITTTETRY